VKHHFQFHGHENPAEFAGLVVRAAITAITPEIARNQFRHCGYRVD
jgi:hypothetical protein